MYIKSLTHFSEYLWFHHDSFHYRTRIFLIVSEIFCILFKTFESFWNLLKAIRNLHDYIMNLFEANTFDTWLKRDRNVFDTWSICVRFRPESIKYRTCIGSELVTFPSRFHHISIKFQSRFIHVSITYRTHIDHVSNVFWSGFLHKKSCKNQTWKTALMGKAVFWHCFKAKK